MTRANCSAAPTCADSLFKRRRIGEDVIGRCQKGRLCQAVGASQWVEPSCAISLARGTANGGRDDIRGSTPNRENGA